MRLEEDEHAALPRQVARGAQRRGHLGGMVGVVVDDAHAAGFPARLEPPPRAAELGERRQRVLPRHARELGARSAVAALRRLCSPGTASSAASGSELLPVDNLSLRQPREPVLEECLDLRPRTERRMVVEIEVRDHGDLGRERRDRTVRLVALDDEPPGARSSVAAELRDLAADRIRRVAAEALEHERDHRRRRRLAVRARTTIEGASPASSARNSARGIPSIRSA